MVGGCGCGCVARVVALDPQGAVQVRLGREGRLADGVCVSMCAFGCSFIYLCICVCVLIYHMEWTIHSFLFFHFSTHPLKKLPSIPSFIVIVIMMQIVRRGGELVRPAGCLGGMGMGSPLGGWG